MVTDSGVWIRVDSGMGVILTTGYSVNYCNNERVSTKAVKTRNLGDNSRLLEFALADQTTFCYNYSYQS